MLDMARKNFIYILLLTYILFPHPSYGHDLRPVLFACGVPIALILSLLLLPYLEWNYLIIIGCCGFLFLLLIGLMAKAGDDFLYNAWMFTILGTVCWISPIFSAAGLIKFIYNKIRLRFCFREAVFKKSFTGRGKTRNNFIAVAEFGKDIMFGDKIIITGEEFERHHKRKWAIHNDRYEWISNIRDKECFLCLRAGKGNVFCVEIQRPQLKTKQKKWSGQLKNNKIIPPAIF